MNYKHDTLYCGVREELIKSATPELNKDVVKQWFFHQRERTEIYYKKEILKLQPPWTEDEILQKYKFVNTKRTWDRETRWLLDNVIYNKEMTYKNKILNCILFRVINKGITLDILGGALDFNTLTLDQINIDFRKKLKDKAKEERDYVFFSAAYILGGPKQNFGKELAKIEGQEEPNMVVRMIKFILYKKDLLIEGIMNSANQKQVYDHLCCFPGIGRFLAYQMFIDMTYIDNFPFTEHNFVVSGPGCDRGVNWIFTNKSGMTTEECLFWFTENQFIIADQFSERWDMDEIFHFLDKKDRRYTLMDMENSGACEIDKRCRTIFNGKRPKQLYKHTNGKNTGSTLSLF